MVPLPDNRAAERLKQNQDLLPDNTGQVLAISPLTENRGQRLH